MNTKDRIKRIQAYLGVGSDGVIGPATLTAAELRIGLQAPPSVTRPAVPAEMSLAVSRRSLEEIIGYEIGTPAYYQKSLARPSWPGGASGATIGIGYDLGYNSKSQIDRDWSGMVSDGVLSHLKGASGIRGEVASGVARALRNSAVVIELDPARQVFSIKTLPRFAALTRATWPGIDALPFDAQGALLSLVFNRGAKLTGSTRVEMRNICQLVKSGDLDGIAAQIVAMKRLWQGKNLPGLLKRRESEAKTVRDSKRKYEPGEIVYV